MINAAGDNAFDIHEKLKKHGAKWLYMHEENSHQINTNYEFCTNFIGEIEFAIYERHGNHFILVDFLNPTMKHVMRRRIFSIFIQRSEI
ncbi:hypothetical protein [Klebsiella quasipneumoniae]|jgi:hypothetical protein|uniref:hypothetical protein n=1 Tax=Klebsiella quasipneumoniae TaxID=1463165 RepID=UPI00188CE9AE|nr:hypothetical protein [Klebsiella quasipneumoniae]